MSEAVARSRFRGDPVPLVIGDEDAELAPVSAGNREGASSSSAGVEVLGTSIAGGGASASSAALESDARIYDEAVWKQFTPVVVNDSLCQARTWAQGRGGQCKRKPQLGEKLCSSHMQELNAAGLKHGWLTGSIPDNALRKFQNEKGRGAGSVKKTGVESSSAVGVAGERPVGNRCSVGEEDPEFDIAQQRRKMKAADFFDLEAGVDGSHDSDESIEDGDAAVEVDAWMTDGDGSGEQSDEEGLHRRVDLAREQSASRVRHAPGPALQALRRSSRVAARGPAQSSVATSGHVVGAGEAPARSVAADHAEARADAEAHRGIGSMAAAQRMQQRSQARQRLEEAELRGR